jgi:glutathione S-transferase
VSSGKFRIFAQRTCSPLPTVEIIWDSLAIMEYLSNATPMYGPGMRTPCLGAQRACEMHSGFIELRSQCSMNCGLRLKLHEIGPGLRADIARIDAIWTEGRSRFGGPWLTGAELGAADAFYAPVAFRVQTCALPLGDSAQAYAELLLGHPAMKEWYAAAMIEPWRETGHDNEALKRNLPD